MRNLKIIDQLALVEGKLMCKTPSNRSYQKAHYKQGDLDGACGAYSIAMALNIQGIFEADILYSNEKVDKRTVQWKLISALNAYGLYRDGLLGDQLQRIINDNFKSKATAVCVNKEDHDFFECIQKWLDNNNPVIIGIDYNKNDGHWIVAIGYGYDEKENMTHLLILDPGCDSPTSAYWNGIINLAKVPRKKMGYGYSSKDFQMVDISEAIAIIPKSKE